MKHFLLITFLFLSSAVFANEQVCVNVDLNKLDTINVENDQVWIGKDVSEGVRGGEGTLITFICMNTRYPARARENGIQGKVNVSFIIEKDGSISNIKVVNGIGGGCDEEALRVISLFPDFIPVKKNGVPVRAQYVVPVLYKIF